MLLATSTAGCETGQACDAWARHPILFVHGSGMTPATWSAMQATFVTLGYRPEYLHAIELIPRDGDNRRAAERMIAPAVDQLISVANERFRDRSCPGAPPAKVDIVAHSMGAFSSRWYAAMVAPAKVRRLLSIAGANHGTETLCDRPGAGDRQLCPAFDGRLGPGRLQAMLNGMPDEPRDETPYGSGVDSPRVERIPPDTDRRIVFYSIRIDPDRWIIPTDSAILDGAGGLASFAPNVAHFRETSPGNLLYLGGGRHDGLPAQPEIIEFAYQFLLTDQD